MAFWHSFSRFDQFGTNKAIWYKDLSISVILPKASSGNPLHLTFLRWILMLNLRFLFPVMAVIWRNVAIHATHLVALLSKASKFQPQLTCNLHCGSLLVLSLPCGTFSQQLCCSMSVIFTAWDKYGGHATSTTLRMQQFVWKTNKIEVLGFVNCCHAVQFLHEQLIWHRLNAI